MDEIFELNTSTGILENTQYTDSDSIFLINGRTVSVGNYIVVVGDNNAQVITFEINRYVEGKDISNCTYEINYKRSDANKTTGTSNGTKGLINLRYSDTKVRFSWLIDSDVTLAAGDLSFVIKISGNDGLLMRTLPAKIIIQNTLITEVNQDANVLNLGDVIYYGNNTPNSTTRLWFPSVGIKVKDNNDSWVYLSDLAGSGTGGGTGTYVTPLIAMAATTATIQPNKMYKWGEVSVLNITLATPTDTSIVNEYMFQFTSGASATTLANIAGVSWYGGVPTILSNKTYQASIINGIGVIVGV